MAERGGIASFYRLWTLREAISKATGQGLAMFMDGIDRLPAEPHTGHWLSADRQWLLAHLEPRPNLSLALAVLHEAPVAAGDWSPASVCWLSQPEVDAWSRLPDHSLHQDREWRAKAPV